MIGRCLFGVVCAVVLVFSLTAARGTDRAIAERRWAASAPAAYRMVVQMERAGGTCVQELEVRTGQETRTLRDTCPTSWIGALTVTRMFELAARLDLPAECYPGQSNCVCRRLRVGTVEYNPDNGYPEAISWQRDIRPNPLELAYWRETARTKQIPGCSGVLLPVRIRVVMLEPLT